MLAESRMMIPDCHKRLEAALADLKGVLVLYIFLISVVTICLSFVLFSHVNIFKHIDMLCI